jgi:hypothetical protein
VKKMMMQVALAALVPAYGLAGMPAFAAETEAAAEPATDAAPKTATAPKKPAAPKPAQFVPGGRPGAAGSYQTMRWAEDWSKPAKPDAGLLAKIKHVPLAGDDVYVTFGGGLRLYYTDWTHSTLGLKANDANSPTQSRARLYADVHATPYLRAFVELGDNREYGEASATAPNNDRFDIQQAFVDVTVPLGDAGKITLRPGRYEMPLGNGKLVGVREGLNMRFSYQGLDTTYILPGKLIVNAFSVRPVNIKIGSFDDGPNHNVSFMGVYSTLLNVVDGWNSDLYYYQTNRTSAVTREATGTDYRQNYGARLNKRGKVFDFDLEGNLQQGHLKGQPINAYALMLDTGYTLGARSFKPRLGLRANIFSGDKDLNDGKAGTFLPAFVRMPLISEAAFFNPANLVDVYPNLTVKPHKDLTIMAGPDFLWRQREADGVYIGSAGSSLKPYAGSRAIGTDLNIEATWQATRQLQFRAYETYFAASQSLRADGGASGNYFGILGEYRF